MADCPGNCNLRFRRAQDAYRKAKADYDPLDPDTSPPEEPRIRPMDGNPWCLECAWQIRLQLAQLDTLAALRMSADGYAADAGPERVSGSRETASPSPHHDDVDDTARMLAGWEAAYRDLRGWPSGPRHGDLAHQRTECAAWLLERLDGVLASAMALDFGTEIMAWHADLKSKTKAGVRTLKKPLRCPLSIGGCGLLMLTYTDGDKYVRCCNPACAVLLPLPEYEAEVERQAAAVVRLAIE